MNKLIPELTEINVDSSNEITIKKVVDLSNEELKIFYQRFSRELFGHGNFKEHFFKCIQNFRVLNSIKEKRYCLFFIW